MQKGGGWLAIPPCLRFIIPEAQAESRGNSQLNEIVLHLHYLSSMSLSIVNAAAALLHRSRWHMQKAKDLDHDHAMPLRWMNWWRFFSPRSEWWAHCCANHFRVFPPETKRAGGEQCSFCMHAAQIQRQSKLYWSAVALSFVFCSTTFRAHLLVFHRKNDERKTFCSFTLLTFTRVFHFIACHWD